MTEADIGLAEGIDSIIDNFNCSICLNKFTKPKIIDCFHTFCEMCLQHYTDTFTEQNLTYFPCPLCRKNIRIPADGITGFSTNFYLQQTPKDKFESICNEHKREIDLYCKDCCVTICSKCFLTKHNGHTACEIENQAVNCDAELQELLSELQHNMNKLEKYSGVLKLEKREIVLSYEAECDKVNTYVKKICNNVKDYGKQFKIEIKKVCVRESDKLEEALKSISKLIIKYESLIQDSCQVLNENNKSNMLRFTQKLNIISMEGRNRVYFPIEDRVYPIFVQGDMFDELLSKQFGELHKETKSSYFCSLESHNGNNAISKEKTKTSRNLTRPRKKMRSSTQVASSNSEIEFSFLESLSKLRTSETIPAKRSSVCLPQKVEDCSKLIAALGDHIDLDQRNPQYVKLNTGDFSFHSICDKVEEENRQLVYEFELTEVLEKGMQCLQKPTQCSLFKSDKLSWTVTAIKECNSNISILMKLECLGLYRVSFSSELMNVKDLKDCIKKEDTCCLIQGIWGSGYKWSNLIDCVELSDPDNGFIDISNIFTFKVLIYDVHRLK